ncbi:MAG TPA: methylated-DNA--[protein]-cysteine S-methyltransferase [Candidatus Angelobacter sp.]|jgi:O-6-methylguanine DNA methyltransferase|nr:methylated-DNA--[protein]-cysteine S-methyltransferase [Candidatus Angelobacter sp.]
MVRNAVTDDALIAALHRAGTVRAPSSLLARVLSAVGVGTQYASLPTDIGDIWIAWTARGVRAAMRAASAEEFAQWYAGRFGVAPARVSALPVALERGVRAVLAGDGGRASLHFDLDALTPFEQQVLQTTLRIPRGEVRPYSWVARSMGRPLAVRAVGTALAHNPIPYLIPCHRVVRADGHLGEYSGGGPGAKRDILDWEGVDAAELERLARRGVRFIGSDTTHVFCYPTCHNARRITDPHRVPFASAGHATRAGYRACKVCAPASIAA